MPLWLLMHVTPSHTFIGSQQQGYIMLLTNLVRPSLCIIGLFAGLLILDPIVNFICHAFVTMYANVQSGAGGVAWFSQFLTWIWWMGIFGLLLLPIFYMLFAMSQNLPDTVLSWIGAGIQSLGATDAVAEVRSTVSRSNMTQGAGLVRLGARGTQKRSAPDAITNEKAPARSRPGGGEIISSGPQGVIGGPDDSIPKG